jgi:hypothetical protein
MMLLLEWFVSVDAMTATTLAWLDAPSSQGRAKRASAPQFRARFDLPIAFGQVLLSD